MRKEGDWVHEGSWNGGMALARDVEMGAERKHETADEWLYARDAERDDWKAFGMYDWREHEMVGEMHDWKVVP